MIFDAHFHVIDRRFPITAGPEFEPHSFTVEDYRARIDAAGGVVVTGAFQGFDRSYLPDALERLGPGFLAVVQLETSVSDAELRELSALGVRGLRFNVRRGTQSLDELVALGQRVAALVDWHVELHVDAAAGLPVAQLEGLRVSVDHLGISAAGLPALLRAVDQGWKVKASGFGRTDHDVPAALRAIDAVDPTALLFGSDLPSTRNPPRGPFTDADVQLIRHTLPGAERVLHANARAFYRA
ncbi:amidohydrolase family protein [Solirubrobacter ginsenosidimutans]|uniref:Amidohydrolase family protein n=1 Tax=Solirubrobacter ginsenosidimutans TaxID=490573 RepID=A0A9X3MMC6_9ACTN|nr:amidohydrolase family protein [Solirubrobacter ginsenosidimutans]MDA0159246.1 amidohydrolase family protein [Solirubrobacter ginsenosidimutans]